MRERSVVVGVKRPHIYKLMKTWVCRQQFQGLIVRATGNTAELAYAQFVRNIMDHVRGGYVRRVGPVFQDSQGWHQRVTYIPKMEM